MRNLFIVGVIITATLLAIGAVHLLFRHEPEARQRQATTERDLEMLLYQDPGESDLDALKSTLARHWKEREQLERRWHR